MFKKFISYVTAVALICESGSFVDVCALQKVKKETNNSEFVRIVAKSTGIGAAVGLVASGAVVLALLGGNTTKSRNIDYGKLIQKLDDDLIWKMVIDGRYHSKGKDICDIGGKITKDLSANAEPGYLKAMLKAFRYMVSTIGKEKLTSDLFRTFHQETLTGVQIETKRDRFNYRHETDVNCFFSVIDSNSTKKGKQELQKKKSSGWDCERKMTSEIKKVDGKLKLYGSKFSSIDEATDFVQNVFYTYYKRLEELKENGVVGGSWISPHSSEEDKKLEIIIRTCQCLDQAHTFYDGNIRTIVFLLMNKMLVENGLSPVCMWNPNCLDVMDVKTLIKKVREGQKAFEKIFVKS